MSSMHGGLAVRVKALVADDERNVRDLFERILAAIGYEVELVESGEAAVDAVSNKAYDLVILDLRMPGMGGLAALAEIKRSRPGIATMIVSGSLDQYEAELAAAREKGLFEIAIEKPFSLQALRESAKRALEAATRAA